MLLVRPKYGENYTAGQVFFTYRIGSPISKGIVFFSRHDLVQKLLKIHKVSHVGICTGYAQGVESRISGGIQKKDLHEYFDDPYTRIFFKEPRLLTSLGEDELINSAYSRIGEGYDPLLILGHALAAIFWPWRHQILQFFNKSGSVCSEFTAWSLRVNGFMNLPGVVRREDYEWKPQDLFDSGIFKPWKPDIEGLLKK
jgi:hypothetical protein